jgi:hypothetical protein
MHIKITLTFCLTPVRMAIIKNTNINKFWQRCKEKQTLIHSWWNCKLVQPLWKVVWRFLWKAQFLIVKPWKEPRCPTTDEWIKKRLYITE